MAKAPNIIICQCDQLRAFEVGCYGNEVIRTPHIDGLGARGVRFETAVSSCPLCLPARSALLSGQYARRCIGSHNNVYLMEGTGAAAMTEYPAAGRPHLRDVTLPEALRDLGYHTTAIGKWHLHCWPNDIGFDSYLVPRNHHCHSGQNYTENGGREFAPQGWSVDFECARVGEFLRERKGESDEPFFLYYNIAPPHSPINDGPDHYTKMYDPAAIPLRPNVDLTAPVENQDQSFKLYRWDYRHYILHLPYTETLPDGYGLRNVMAEYYGMTTWVDDCVGRLLDNLAANGLDENTIVVFMSDHGDYLGSHGRVQKGRLQEESIRVPMMVRWPAQLKPRVVRAQVASTVDVMPTLLELAGGDIPEAVQGQSLAAVVRGECDQAAGGPHAFIESGGEGVGIRTLRHLYGLPWGDERRSPVLADRPRYFYDLREDPYQLNNLAGTRTQGDVAVELDRQLRAWHSVTSWMASNQ